MPDNPNPDIIGLSRRAAWWELGEVQAFVVSLTTSGASWITGLLDWRAFAAMNLVALGVAIRAVMRKGSYRPVDPEQPETAGLAIRVQRMLDEHLASQHPPK